MGQKDDLASLMARAKSGGIEVTKYPIEESWLSGDKKAIKAMNAFLKKNCRKEFAQIKYATLKSSKEKDAYCSKMIELMRLLKSLGIDELHPDYFTKDIDKSIALLNGLIKIKEDPSTLINPILAEDRNWSQTFLFASSDCPQEDFKAICRSIYGEMNQALGDDYMHFYLHMINKYRDDGQFARQRSLYKELMECRIHEISEKKELTDLDKEMIELLAYQWHQLNRHDNWNTSMESAAHSIRVLVDPSFAFQNEDERAQVALEVVAYFESLKDKPDEVEKRVKKKVENVYEKPPARIKPIQPRRNAQGGAASAGGGSRDVGQPQMVQVDDGMTPAARKQRGVAELDEVEELNEGLAESKDNDDQEQVKNNRTTLSVLRKNLDKMIQSANKFTAFMAHIDGLKKTIMTRLNRSAMQREAQPVSYQVNGVTKQNLGILNLPYSTGELAEATMLMQGPLDSDAQKNALVEAMAGKQLHFDDSTRTVTVEILGQSGRTILLSEGYYPLALRAQLIISLGRMQSTSDDDEYEQHAKAAMDACKRMMQYLEKGETLPHVMITDDFTNFVNHDEIFLAVYHAAYPDLSDDKVVDNVQMYQNMFKKAIESNASASAAATAPAAGAAQTQQTEIQKGNKRIGFFGFGANKKGQKTAKTESKQVVATASAGEGAKREDKGKSELTEPKRALQRELEEALKKQRRSDGVSGGNSTRPK